MESEALLGVGFRVALSELARLPGGTLLERAAADAYREAILALRGCSSRSPMPDMPDMPEPVGFHFHEAMVGEDSALVAFRCEALLPGHGRYPVLDADITLTPAGNETALARLVGVYRLPSAALAGLGDRSTAHAVVAGTAQVLLSRIVRAMTRPGEPAP